MPKLTKIKKSKRAPVRQQDVFEFGPKIEVAARPVDYDTRVVAKNVSGGAAQALLDGLGLAGDLATNYNEARKVTEAAHKAEGKIAGARGEALNADATNAFIEGHEMATGMGAVANFNNLMVAKHRELLANEASPAEYESAMIGMEREFLASGSDAYTEGAIRGGALDAQKNLSAEYAKAQFKRLQAKGLYNINGIVDNKMAEIAAMPSETVKDQLMQAIAARNVMSSMQELGMSQYNLDRNMVNASVVKHLSPIAQAQGNPSLFAYAFIDDGTGQKIINTESGPAIYAAMDLAENQRKSDVKTATAAEEKAIKLRIEDGKRQMSLALASGKREDIIAASHNFMQMQDVLSGSDIDAYVKDMQDYASGFGYAEVTDMQAFYLLKEDAIHGTLSYNELHDAKDLLEPSHFKEILDKMVAYDEKERTRVAGKADPRESEISRSRSALKPILNREDKFGKRAEPLAGPRRAAFGGRYFDDLMKRFQNDELKWLPNKKKRQFPDFDERDKIEQKTLFESYKRHPAVGYMKGKMAFIDPESGDNTDDPTVGKVNWEDDTVDNVH